MTEPNVSGGNTAGDAQDNRYADIVSTVPEEPKAETQPPKEEPKAESEDVVDAEAETHKVNESEEDEDAEPKRKKGGFTRKLEKLEAKLAEYEAKFAQKQEPVEQKAEMPSDKPKSEDYENYDEFLEALTDWKVEQVAKKNEAKTKEDSYRRQMEALAESYKVKAEQLAKQIPDFEQVIEECDIPVTNVMQQALLESDMGPEVAYYLAKNPEQAEKASKMGLVELNKFIGRIEERLESQKSQKVVKKQTQAPAPISPLGNGKTAKAWSLNDPDIPYEEYVKLRGAR